MKKLFLILISACTLIISCTDNENEGGNNNNGALSFPDSLGLNLIFHSGFEPGTEIAKTKPHRYDIEGTDYSFDTLNNWYNNLKEYPNIGRFVIELKDGTENDRFAAIVDDPTGVSNKVLQFWLKHPHEIVNETTKKGRVQASMSNNVDLTEVYQKIRLFIHEDFNILKAYPKSFAWMGVFEVWNDPNWGVEGDYPFRFGLNIKKAEKDTVESFYFRVKGQTRDNSGPETLWEETNYDYPVPVGEWFTLETYMKEGDANNGRYYVAITSDKDVKTVLFDITDYTYHPSDPNFTDGFPFFNPMKLYTSDDIVNFVDENGGTLQFFWDDFELYLKQ